MLDIISRKDAKRIGQNLYFTGKPCRHGHVSERYVQSGTCRMCINGDPWGLSARSAKQPLPNLEVLRARQMFIDNAAAEIKVTIYRQDIEAVKAFLYACAMMRCPVIQLDDLWVGAKPMVGIIYRVRCHDDDVAAVRQYTNDLFRLHSKPVIPPAPILTDPDSPPQPLPLGLEDIRK